ncbi:uncharacterized protein LOC124655917 [Lolium rigidum]|uniref:uncharacterized protein LOC124655917 n=1 Tax=Lolium rigidum TaxID=89674 RepID=UPI001F5CF046|nr:uncharacterized protein LOC124655917 [Lolium rigidum]
MDPRIRQLDCGRGRHDGSHRVDPAKSGCLRRKTSACGRSTQFARPQSHVWLSGGVGQARRSHYLLQIMVDAIRSTSQSHVWLSGGVGQARRSHYLLQIMDTSPRICNGRRCVAEVTIGCLLYLFSQQLHLLPLFRLVIAIQLQSTCPLVLQVILTLHLEFLQHGTLC